MENNGVVIPPVDPEAADPAAPAAPQLDNSRPSQRRNSHLKIITLMMIFDDIVK